MSQLIYLCIGETNKTITGGYSFDKSPKVLEFPQENPFVEDGGTNRFYLVNCLFCC